MNSLEVLKKELMEEIKEKVREDIEKEVKEELSDDIKSHLIKLKQALKTVQCDVFMKDAEDSTGKFHSIENGLNDIEGIIFDIEYDLDLDLED